MPEVTAANRLNERAAEAIDTIVDSDGGASSAPFKQALDERSAGSDTR